MGKLSELGVAVVASIAIAIVYGVTFSNEYPLAPITSALAGLFAIAGILSYLLIGLILHVIARRSVRQKAARDVEGQSPEAEKQKEAIKRQLSDLKGGARPNEKRCYVSYAWADGSDPKREELVDKLCEEAGRRGVPIFRDKTTLVHGDLISEFMQRIGEGDRIFVFLSDKYLHSPFCMYELFEMWRNSKQNKSDLLRRVRFFTLDGTKIGEPKEWLEYTRFWRQQRDELKKSIDDVGWENAGEEAIRRYRHMDTFTGNISDVLALFADTVQPRKFEDFLAFGFDDVA
jgi:TIR domain